MPLLKLVPEGVSTYWTDFIKPSLQKALAPTADFSEEVANNVLQALLVTSMQAWLILMRTENGYKVAGVIVTAISQDTLLGVNNLLIYSLASSSDDAIRDSTYTEAAAALVRYGRAKGCSKLMAYSNDERLLSIGRRLKGDFTTFVSLNIGD